MRIGFRSLQTNAIRSKRTIFATSTIYKHILLSGQKIVSNASGLLTSAFSRVRASSCFAICSGTHNFSAVRPWLASSRQKLLAKWRRDVCISLSHFRVLCLCMTIRRVVNSVTRPHASIDLLEERIYFVKTEQTKRCSKVRTPFVTVRCSLV